MEEIILKYRKKIITGLALGLVVALSFGMVNSMLVTASDGDYTLTLESSAGGSVEDTDESVYEGDFEMSFGDEVELTANPDDEEGFVFDKWSVPEGVDYTVDDVATATDGNDPHEDGIEHTEEIIVSQKEDDGTTGDPEFDDPIELTAEFSSDDEVSVSTRLMAWLSFSADTSIDLQELVTSDGETQLGNAYSSLSVGTNNSKGWDVLMRGNTKCDDSANGDCSSSRSSLHGESSDYYIGSSNERFTVSAGDDQYGALTQPLVDENGECLVGDSGADGKCESEGDSFWNDGETPRGNPTLTSNGTGDYVWAPVGKDDDGNDIDSDEGMAGVIPYDSSNTVIGADLPHDTATVARFHIRAAANAMAPSDEYTDQITLTAIGGD